MYIIKYTDLGIDKIPRYLINGNVFTTNINRATSFKTIEELNEYAYKNAPAGYEILDIGSET